MQLPHTKDNLGISVTEKKKKSSTRILALDFRNVNSCREYLGSPRNIILIFYDTGISVAHDERTPVRLAQIKPPANFNADSSAHTRTARGTE